jgi:hypothetical protein
MHEDTSDGFDCRRDRRIADLVRGSLPAAAADPLHHQRQALVACYTIGCYPCRESVLQEAVRSEQKAKCLHAAAKSSQQDTSSYSNYRKKGVELV